MSNQAGKGSKSRPFSVPQETFDNNWNRIFNKKKEENECHYSGLRSVKAYEEKKDE
jgi:hypothetical protein